MYAARLPALQAIGKQYDTSLDVISGLLSTLWLNPPEFPRILMGLAQFSTVCRTDAGLSFTPRSASISAFCKRLRALRNWRLFPDTRSGTPFSLPARRAGWRRRQDGLRRCQCRRDAAESEAPAADIDAQLVPSPLPVDISFALC